MTSTRGENNIQQNIVNVSNNNSKGKKSKRKKTNKSTTSRKRRTLTRPTTTTTPSTTTPSTEPTTTTTNPTTNILINNNYPKPRVDIDDINAGEYVVAREGTKLYVAEVENTETKDLNNKIDVHVYGIPQLTQKEQRLYSFNEYELGQKYCGFTAYTQLGPIICISKVLYAPIVVYSEVFFYNYKLIDYPFLSCIEVQTLRS